MFRYIVCVLSLAPSALAKLSLDRTDRVVQATVDNGEQNEEVATITDTGAVIYHQKNGATIYHRKKPHYAISATEDEKRDESQDVYMRIETPADTQNNPNVDGLLRQESNTLPTIMPTIYHLKSDAAHRLSDAAHNANEAASKNKYLLILAFFTILITALAVGLQRRGAVSDVMTTSVLGSLLLLLMFIPEGYVYVLLPPGMGTNLYVVTQLGVIIVCSRMLLKEPLVSEVCFGFLFCVVGSVLTSVQHPQHVKSVAQDDLRALSFLIVLTFIVVLLCVSEGNVRYSHKSIQTTYLPFMGALLNSISHLCLVLISVMAPFMSTSWSISAISNYVHSPHVVTWGILMLFAALGNFSILTVSTRIQTLSSFFPRYFAYSMFLNEIETWFVVQDLDQISLLRFSASSFGMVLIMIGCFIITKSSADKKKAKNAFVPWDKFLVSGIGMNSSNGF